MSADELTITAADGAAARARLFAPADAGSLPAVLVWPAMGTAASYYDRLASALAARGHAVVVAENRGTGTIDQKPERGARFGYHDMVTHDLPVWVEAVRRQFPGRKVVLLGHSLGGQLGVLFAGARPGALDALVIVAGGSVHYKTFPGAARLRVLFGTQLAAVIARLWGYFPGHRLGFGGKQPTRLIRDWARFARTGKLTPEGADVDYEQAMASARLPLLGVSVEGDTLAPRSSLLALVGKLPKADARHEHVTLAPGKSDPHFRWARTPEPVVEVVSAFLTQLS
jgi:predicted alpha/beta hydrolase